MMRRVEMCGLQIEERLYRFLSEQALPGTGVAPERFWSGFSALVHRFGPVNRELLARRDTLQEQLDSWHLKRRREPHDPVAYRSHLEAIGYLLPKGPKFEIATAGVDPEIASISGPQLVVPLTNARYAINAANARWGSLYDAFYGTNALGDPPPPGPYDPGRGARVVARAKEFLDDIAPLVAAQHSTATRYWIDGAQLRVQAAAGETVLVEQGLFAGYVGNPSAPDSILLRHNGLHVEIRFDRTHRVGAVDAAGIADIVLESAVTTIMDCEDSVAAVDGPDKVLVYENWFGLIRGTLAAPVTKQDQTFLRRLNPDRQYVSPTGSRFQLRGRSLLLVRNVGHLMTNPAMLDRNGAEVYEGLLDAMCTVLVAMHDFARPAGSRNSPAGSIYVVKPKMHGPAEVAFADSVFAHVETVLGLPSNAVKIGIMDEERRTTVNLTECLRAARTRVCFINTGFLDRTGDEIHTSMEAGAVVRKADMKRQRWIAAYEAANVEAGLECGLPGRAQIGKGMWAAPDQMKEMLEQKIGHPRAGASCAWVPSPTAATLHAMHYHAVDVAKQQAIIAGGERPDRLADILAIPLAPAQVWAPEGIIAEVENNAQSILGYVVRWVDQGIGCSKVPDITNVALMEDRATCRISSQHIANWLHHGVVSAADVLATMRRMAAVVDAQNASDPAYVPMAPGYDGLAFQAACDLVFEARRQPSGYTEPVLHRRRLELKRREVRSDARDDAAQ